METSFIAGTFHGHMEHEPDWTGWVSLRWGPGEDIVVEARLLALGEARVLDRLPCAIAVAACAAAARAHQKYLDGVMLHRNNSTPRIDRDGYVDRDRAVDMDPSWLFASDLVTRNRIPLGWISNVALHLCPNERSDVMFDVGAPPLHACTCPAEAKDLAVGRPRLHMHDVTCPARDTFPRIGRLGLSNTFARILADALIEAADGKERRIWP